MTRLSEYRWHYNRPFFPWRRMLFDWREWFNRWNWDPGCSPGYLTAAREWLDNALVWLTPWYRPRRRLLDAFVNLNATKLLSMDRKYAYVRTRGEETVYSMLHCGFLSATLRREVLVEKKTGRLVNAFATGILVGLCGQGDRSDYEERLEKVLSGPCLTAAQCQRLLDRIVEAAPECGWDA